MESQIEIYQGSDGQTQLEVKFDQETVWLSQEQLVTLFQRDQSVISRHLSKIFKEGELDEKSNMQKMHIPSSDKPVAFYNLEVIISVGYRVKSVQGTQFRIWATQRLKDFLVQGYLINEKRLAQKQQEVQALKEGIRILSRAIELKAQDQDLDWLSHFAKGLELLDDYDHENLDKAGLSKKEAVYPSMADYQKVISAMRSDFDIWAGKGREL
ncbi:virulence RhuM family protein [Algoriphagus sp. H41]|uniref:Virulence RhuM family protein n=1 Tax=Algoriphagus oliviformis TaxID=2811231 RepID=A0ABS3C867_9BACT|nr:RhuM family protein [Algoriphagus oliviformis]MBN7811809.1 virulence RhuM family protein [Algoriphagus oliviformis]